jgi:FkbM family methyltransferase
MRQTLLNTALGRLALSARSSSELAIAGLRRPEILGTLSNDHLAGYLTTRLCKDSRTFIDVGAHIGSIISEVSHHCPTVKIVAIEAMPDKVGRLRRKFPKVECHGCAVSDTEGEATFFVNTAKSGYSSLGRPANPDGSNVTEIRVPLRTLDGLISSREVDLIKIDVEGAELGVLRGGERLIGENRPLIMFESGSPTLDGLGYTKESMWEWFAGHEYCVVVPNRLAHNDPGLSLEGFVESHLYPRRSTNYFGVPTERRKEVRDRARVVLKIQAGP